MDKFQGESRYINNINNYARFDFYFNGNNIGTFATSSQRDIENHIRMGEQYVMKQLNARTPNKSGCTPLCLDISKWIR